MEVILGTMTFGSQVNSRDVRIMLDNFQRAGYRRIDTAHKYGEGKTEALLGEVLGPGQRQGLHIATKVHPGNGGGLSRKALRLQLETSLKRLDTEAVDLLYLHQPDHQTPIEETLETCRELQEQGKFHELGLSNYAAWQVADIHHVCLRNKYPLPAVYQGMYNALTRKVEDELFPALRRFHIAFYAYNPLAGGLLAGRHSDQSQMPDSGRFQLFPFYQDRYWKDSYFKALDSISRQCAASNLGMAEAALRFLRHHCALRAEAGDGIILGAGTVEHLLANLQAIENGPLPETLREAFEQAWPLTRPACPRYFR